MALRTSGKSRNSRGKDQPPIIRSPALENLEQIATSPDRARSVAGTATEARPRSSSKPPSGPLGDAREGQETASDTQPSQQDRHIDPLPVHAGRADYRLLAIVSGLLCFGLVMVYSASTSPVYGDPSSLFRRELLWVGLGLITMFLTMNIPYDRWRYLSIAVMAGALVLLVLVLVVGKNVNGGQRWLPVGPFTFQPSELAKLAFTLYIADWLSRKGKQVSSFMYGLVPFAILTGVVIMLVMLQNDMGTAIIIATFAVAMFITAGANLLHLLPMMLSGVVTFAWIAFNTPFRVSRLEAFRDPLNCGPTSPSYQVCQGLLALGSGGITGLGLGNSRQKAGYLPNPWTDSIFAVIGEELGFIGCFIVILLIVMLTYRAFRVGRRALEVYGGLLATGVACWIAVQAMLNIGSVVAIIPFTGVPLPFISFGGSSLVTTMAAIGILLNISRYSDYSSSSGTEKNADTHLRRRDRRPYLSGAGRR
jgi:cell division protein FtsW